MFCVLFCISQSNSICTAFTAWMCLFGWCCHIWFSLRVILILRCCVLRVFFFFLVFSQTSLLVLLPSTNKLKHNHLNHCILKIRLTRSHISGFSVFCCIRSRWWFLVVVLFFSLSHSPRLTLLSSLDDAFSALLWPAYFLCVCVFFLFGRAVSYSAK